MSTLTPTIEPKKFEHTGQWLAFATISTSIIDTSCYHCGAYHTGQCPRAKEIEYFPNVAVKWIEYHS